MAQHLEKGLFSPHLIEQGVVDFSLKEVDFSVVLKNRSGNTDIVKKDIIEIFGATFEPVNDDEMTKLGIENGLKIVKIRDGKLKRAGINEGFIIVYVDKEPVRGVDDLKMILETKEGGTLIEGMYPNGQKAYFGLGL